MVDRFMKSSFVLTLDQNPFGKIKNRLRVYHKDQNELQVKNVE